MDNIIRTIKEEKELIEKYFSFLGNVEDGNVTFCIEGKIRNLDMVVRTTQKACCIIILYNLIESSMTAIIQRIHNIMIHEKVEFFDLNKNIRNTIISYYNSTYEKNNLVSFSEYLQEFYLLLSHNKRFNLDYEKLSKDYSLYSGNLDSKEIRNVLKNKYGIIFRNEEKLKVSALKTIKEGRNSLAHGNQTFEEYGRALTLNELLSLKNKTFDFFDDLLEELKFYVEKKYYLAHVSKPA